jgi:NTE family protein
MTLHGLPKDGEGPRFIFNATDLATGTDFRFSRPYMGSYRIGLVREPTTLLATAVAASAAFPPIVSPLALRLDSATVIEVPGADLHNRPELLSKIVLVDGGAYDNLALEPVAGRCRIALVSDAGGNLGIAPPTWKWALWSVQVKRTLDIAVSQARGLRRSALATDAKRHPYAIWRTRTDPKAFAKWTTVPFPIHDGWPEYIATLPTRLWPFPLADRQRVVNWGYLTSDLALRSFVWKDAAAPTSLPFSNASFDGPPPRAVDVGGKPIQRN